MKDAVKKSLLMFGVIIVFVMVCVFKNRVSMEDDYREKYEGVDLTVDTKGMDQQDTYTEYVSSYPDATFPSHDVEVAVLRYSEGSDVEMMTDEGKEVLFTGERSEVEWEVEIPQAGFYYLSLEYKTVESRGVSVERKLRINGEVPFANAGNLTFGRMWTDGGKIRTDNQGNQVRPAQVEVYDWQKAYCKDSMGYIAKPYQFWFNEGTNKISLTAVNEPMILRKVILEAVTASETYEEYLAKQPQAEEGAAGYSVKIQGEDAVLRSESSLYAKYDRSSPTTQPYSLTKTILNYTGGETWNSPGQWIEWDFEVPSDGFYNITIKGRQNYARGSVSCRGLYLDGKIPFEEAERIEFGYSNDWNKLTLSDENETPYQFYLTEGTHKIRLEANLGSMGEILEELEESTFRLNQIYRKILVYTGATPDIYRDYNLNKVYPEVLDAMDMEAKRLYKIIDDVVLYTGQKAEKIATAQTLARQMELFVQQPNKITENFSTFKDNITSLGGAILNMSESKLDVDYIVVNTAGAESKDLAEDRNAGLIRKTWHEVKSFGASFVVDYDAVGDVYKGEEDEIVKVWIAAGRDQGTILKTMVDDSFTPESGIKVNVEIVDAGALLNAVVAGRGPDVVLSIGADQPVNYALRNAAEDLSQFEGWEDVYDVFYDSAYRAYEYNGGIYGLPETQTYNVLFYRKDIMKELELEVPQTWEEVIGMLPTIQGNNMTFGIPSPTSTATPDLSLYYTLLYQNGSDVYDESGTHTIIDNEMGVDAFAAYTSFFTEYGMPTEYDFVSRFRSGEMPMGIANYSTYNTLVVSAPEIQGLWDFTLVPGTRGGDDSINRSVYSAGSCSMMIKNDNETTKKNAWEFMKWWADTDVQVRFGRELEALLGSSARYATANKEAFSQLAWSADVTEVLEEQRQSAVGFREVAGGYYTGRHIVNAIRRVINDKEDPRETILDYAITIDDELAKKRIEFGLPVE